MLTTQRKVLKCLLIVKQTTEIFTHIKPSLTWKKDNRNESKFTDYVDKYSRSISKVYKCYHLMLRNS